MKKKLNKSPLRVFVWSSLLFVAAVLFNLPACARDMIEYPRVKLQSLDKATARTMTFDADVGSTLRFGHLYIRVQKCKKSSPIDKPESSAFMQIWEVNKENKPNWVFSGWMFASSPALSAMDHPIYDVWVLDCMDYENATTIEDNATKTVNDDKEAVETEETQKDSSAIPHNDTPSPEEIYE